MTSLPFVPNTLTGALADLAFLVVIVGAPLALKWWNNHQKAIAAWYRAQVPAADRAILAAIAKEGVVYAERFASSPAGAQKLQQAIGYVQGELKALGVGISLTAVVAAIQTAFADLSQSGVLAAAGPTVGPGALHPAAVLPAPAPDPRPVAAAATDDLVLRVAPTPPALGPSGLSTPPTQ